MHGRSGGYHRGMDTEQVIWIVVAVAVVLLIAGLVMWAMRKKQEKDVHVRAEKATEIRHEAERHATVLPDAELRAQEEKVKAEKLRREAERAEERANAAETDYLQQEARYEDQVREADRLDPDVDHTADDYQPRRTDATTSGTSTTSTTTTSGDSATDVAHDPDTRHEGGSHRA